MKRRYTEENWRNDPWFKAFAKALLACKTEQQMGDFLRDIATLSELQAFGERLEVAKQLSRGLSYRQVAENTGASTTTVTRVARFIENGEGGYRTYLKAKQSDIRDRVDEQEEREVAVHEGIKKASVLQKYLNK